MNGVAWVIEVGVGRKNWEPANSYPTRDRARRKARNMVAEGWRVRVRKYIRQPEIRP